MAAPPLGPKNPSTTFYWNDWENDEAVRACSLAAQGLWMRLLCIAARSPEPGVVQIGSLDCSLPRGLPRIAAAVGRSLEEVAPLIDELMASGAADLDRKKRIVNRRMVRAAALHKKRSEAGTLGAEVTNRKKKRKEDLPQQNGGKPPGKEPANQSALHTSRLHASSDTVTTTESGERVARSRATLITEAWRPKPETLKELRHGRPDLVGETYEAEFREFQLWCRSEAVTSHDPEAAFLRFMRRARKAQGAAETYDQRRIREGREALARTPETMR